MNLSLGTWSLEGVDIKGPLIENAQTSVRYTHPRGGKFVVGLREPLQAGAVTTVVGAHGSQRQITCISGLDQNAVRLRVTFALPESQPFLLWYVTIENGGSSPIYVNRLEMFNAGFVYLPPGASPTSTIRRAREEQSHIRPAQLYGDLAFYSNGWQSWNYSGVYGEKDAPRRTRLGPFTAPMRVNPGTPQPSRRGRVGSDMYGVLGDRLHRTGILAGFLSQEQHFGSLEALLGPLAVALRMWANGDRARLDPGQSMVTDWAYLQFLHLDGADPLKDYFEAAARQNGLEGGEPFPRQAVPSGWSSWYHFFQKVTAEDVRSNLGEAVQLRDRLPLGLIQLDDGFEAQVGDWQDFSAGFPDGVAPLAAEIKDAGFSPGLWLAPFIVHPKARLLHEHPDWVLRSRSGRPVNAGFIWDHFTTALDLTVPGALYYCVEVVEKAVQEWGFNFLKLDFLYAAALPGVYQDPTKTRAQVLRTGLAALRQAAGPGIHLLGCGCPLGSALGLFDSMRIGPDVDPRWDPAYKGIRFFFSAEPDMPSARNAIHNAITRAPMHRKWWVNDPDCLLLRPDTLLSEDEVRTLAAVIAMTGGSLLLSDHLPALPDDRLRIAESLLPLIGERAHVLDWFDHLTPQRLQVDLAGAVGGWSLLAGFNWEDQRRDFLFDPKDYYLKSNQEYWACSFWDRQLFRFWSGEAKDGASQTTPEQNGVLVNLPAHGSAVLAVRPAHSHQPQYLGSDLHISQGLEVSGWQWDGEQLLSIELERPGRSKGCLYLALPKPPVQVRVNDAHIDTQPGQLGTYQIPVEFNKTAHVEIRL